MKDFAIIWANNHIKRSHYYTLVSLTILGCLQLILKFGFGWYALGGCFLTYVLLVQSYIDLKYQIIPDQITWPVLWLGIFCNLFGIFTSFSASILGACLGYFSLWLIYWGFLLVTGKEGLGYGDFKLLAMLGAWLGVSMLPLIILISFVLGSIIGIVRVKYMHEKLNTRMAFGPFLAIAGFIALVWGNEINTWYLRNYLHIW